MSKAKESKADGSYDGVDFYVTGDWQFYVPSRQWDRNRLMSADLSQS